jgi:hypothetical protein
LDFLWDGPGIQGNATSETPVVIASGTYTLTVTSVTTGCSSTDQVIVTIDNTPPTVSATSDTITCTRAALDRGSNQLAARFYIPLDRAVRADYE